MMSLAEKHGEVAQPEWVTEMVVGMAVSPPGLPLAKSEAAKPPTDSHAPRYWVYEEPRPHGRERLPTEIVTVEPARHT